MLAVRLHLEVPSLRHSYAQEQAELALRERLEAQGFATWSRHDYAKFLKACERHGRDKFTQISDEIGAPVLLTMALLDARLSPDDIGTRLKMQTAE